MRQKTFLIGLATLATTATVVAIPTQVPTDAPIGLPIGAPTNSDNVTFEAQVCPRGKRITWQGGALPLGKTVVVVGGPSRLTSALASDTDVFSTQDVCSVRLSIGSRYTMTVSIKTVPQDGTTR
ncbi:hypothetical protein BU25DRAFT_420064 [Macroventuria anomochaeta]|uniref:Uncharacterized protein n=1 Tax=Macroventuria anomochaeta TaxID=301207 RepID=A0ACB6S6D6_9PLEO|nr:uncharacterized protein BU25DRAFT_420064 [Macroventuria anomochaeta]KAF2629820.1 hypothetical protein BU25DRAFT_420064 [Macroventuria anomochaeta]